MKDFAVFWGCTIPARFPFIEKATRVVLDDLGARPIDLEGHTCCPEGTLVKANDENAFYTAAARNLAIVEKEGLDLVTPCNGCYSTFKETQSHLRTHWREAEKINERLAKEDLEYKGELQVFHFAEWLSDQMGAGLVACQGDQAVLGHAHRRPLRLPPAAPAAGGPLGRSAAPHQGRGARRRARRVRRRLLDEDAVLRRRPRPRGRARRLARVRAPQAHRAARTRTSTRSSPSARAASSSSTSTRPRSSVPRSTSTFPCSTSPSSSAWPMATTPRSSAWACTASPSSRSWSAGVLVRTTRSGWPRTSTWPCSASATRARRARTTARSARSTRRSSPPRSSDDLLRGDIDKVVDDGQLWKCLECYTCQELCHSEIGMAETFRKLKEIAIAAGQGPRVRPGVIRAVPDHRRARQAQEPGPQEARPRPAARRRRRRDGQADG